ncbi:MAG: PIN domain-containing protein [Atopobiaceae bacterium]|nr:PIN domain-containing protein [Atopobiaceae bacterium]
MLDAKTFLVDTNVWIDYFMATEPHGKEAIAFFEAVDQRGGTLLYAPTTLKDVFFLVPRILRREAQAASQLEDTLCVPAAWACVRTMTESAVAAPLSLPECDLAWALRSAHGDLEDNLIIAAAETCNADYVVSYDLAMLEHFSPACITPEQACNLLSIRS